jgi:LysM repeat protein
MSKSISLLTMVLLTLSGLTILPVHGAPPSDAQVHIVQPGENLSTIAIRYGTTTTALIRANGIADPHRIYAGQRLTISWDGSAGSTVSSAHHTVRRGENLQTIAARYQVSPDVLARANGISNPNLIYIGQRLRIPGRTATTAGTHVVQRGESLSGIARHYGVSVSALVQANGLHNPNFVYVGQRLRTPASGSSATAAGAVAVTSKLIDIDLSNQRMTVWENGRVKWHWACSTGEPGRPTYPGRFGVISKIPNAYSSVYRLQMPWWLGIYWAGSLQNGIHALPIQANGQALWSGLLGRRVSYGCIILDTANARTLYHWADMGTPVTIHY